MKATEMLEVKKTEFSIKSMWVEIFSLYAYK